DCKAGNQFQMHRTKCTALICNVISPHFTDDLKNDIGSSYFSILIDESTDISVHKYLGIAIIYYSTAKKTIVTTYLALLELKECTATGKVAAIKLALNNVSLDMSKLRGIGTDNASVMVGINNGVYSQLKEEVPSLVLIRCVSFLAAGNFSPCKRYTAQKFRIPARGNL
ncbi:MAG: hypothetical protein ACRC6C_02585, partial [Wolbachia pipientis]